MTAIAPHRTGHAPGWTWRREVVLAGGVDQPWSVENPPMLYGLCESGWHRDCPQAPTLVPINGCCSCPCHQGAEPGDPESPT